MPGYSEYSSSSPSTSIPAYFLFQPVLDDPAGYIAGGGEDNQIYFGVVLELLFIIANIGTAVVLYPIARRQNEILALGYVSPLVWWSACSSEAGLPRAAPDRLRPTRGQWLPLRGISQCS
jgi:hypothetical protein